MKTETIPCKNCGNPTLPGHEEDLCNDCYAKQEAKENAAWLEKENLKNLQAPDLTKRCFFALALGYYGRGATLDEALFNLRKAACPRHEPIAVDLFIGDDKPTVINGGLNIEYNPGAIRIRIGLFKSLGAALRNLREP